MNADDFEIADRWNDAGYVRFGRVKANDIQKGVPYPRNRWCALSESAWADAHALRRERAKRCSEKVRVERIGFCGRV